MAVLLRRLLGKPLIKILEQHLLSILVWLNVFFEEIRQNRRCHHAAVQPCSFSMKVIRTILLLVGTPKQPSRMALFYIFKSLEKDRFSSSQELKTWIVWLEIPFSRFSFEVSPLKRWTRWILQCKIKPPESIRPSSELLWVDIFPQWRRVLNRCIGYCWRTAILSEREINREKDTW